jgi:hypothetical protein
VALERRRLPGAATQVDRGGSDARRPDDAVRKLQRSAGNAGVARLLQRYAIVGPADYDRTNVATGNFPFQRLVEEIRNPSVLENRPLLYRAEYETSPQPDKPDLRVADDGSMAIQDSTVGGNALGLEPRTFYATDALIESSNRQLRTIGSTVHLGHTGRTLSVPTNPAHPAAGRHRLSGVEPRKPPLRPGEADAAFQIAVNECSQVAAELMGEPVAESGVAIFEGTSGRATATFDASRELSSRGQHQMAAYAAQAGAGATAAGMTGHLQQVAVDDTVDPQVRAAFRAMFDDALATGKIQTPVDDEVVNRISKRSTPRVAADELVKRILRGETLDRATAEFLIDGYREHAIASSYAGELRGGGPSAPRLGINEAAEPEVGEAYFAASIGTPHVQLRGGAVFDYEHAPLGEEQILAARLADDAQRIEVIKRLVENGLTSLSRNVWSWHAATVVARSGADSVTLENYNRGTTANQISERFWADFTRRHNEAAEAINALLKSRGASRASARERMRLVKDGLYKLTREFAMIDVSVQDELDAAAAETRWYFQMYGPGAQSFHNVWAPTGFVQPLTLRIGSAVPDNAFFERVKDALLAEVLAHTPDAIKGRGNSRARQAFRARQIDSLQPLLALMRAAQTRSEVARLAEQARSALIAAAGSYVVPHPVGHT